MNMKIAVVGDIGVDYYENLKLLKTGGVAFNFAYSLKKSGIKNISLIGVLGDDKFSIKLVGALMKVGLDISHLQKLSGATPKQNIFLKNGERKFTGYDAGVLKKWKLRKKDLKFIESQDTVFVTLNDGMEQIFDTVKMLNGPVKAVDFSQDYEFADFNKKENVITKNVKYFDVIFVGGMKKHEKMIQNLANKYPNKIFVLTLGAQGSIAFNQGKKYIQKAKKIRAVDTTGCGDAFQAGFLASWMGKKNIKTALLKGTKRASSIIKYVGSTPLILR